MPDVDGFHDRGMCDCSEARDVRYGDESLQFTDCGFCEFEFWIVSLLLILCFHTGYKLPVFRKEANGCYG